MVRPQTYEHCLCDIKRKIYRQPARLSCFSIAIGRLVRLSGCWRPATQLALFLGQSGLSSIRRVVVGVGCEFNLVAIGGIGILIAALECEACNC
jgi:hypothetical protein